jgi:hypothetical protein
MRVKQVDGGANQNIYMPVMNEDATLAATIPVGTPLVLALNGTDDGLAVVMPTTAGAAKTEALFYGVAVQNLPYNTDTQGYCLRSGYFNNAVLVIATRSASSASWSSSASFGTFYALTVDTINNAFTTVSASVGTGYQGAFAVLATSIASIAASATATTDTRTAITVAAKVWINTL